MERKNWMLIKILPHTLTCSQLSSKMIWKCGILKMGIGRKWQKSHENQEKREKNTLLKLHVLNLHYVFRWIAYIFVCEMRPAYNACWILIKYLHRPKIKKIPYYLCNIHIYISFLSMMVSNTCNHVQKPILLLWRSAFQIEWQQRAALLPKNWGNG